MVSSLLLHDFLILHSAINGLTGDPETLCYDAICDISDVTEQLQCISANHGGFLRDLALNYMY